MVVLLTCTCKNKEDPIKLRELDTQDKKSEKSLSFDGTGIL